MAVSLIILLVLTTRFRRENRGRFFPFTSFQLCPCACVCLVSVLIPLGVAPGLKMGPIPTVNSWFIIGETDGDWKKLDTEFHSAAGWVSQEQRGLSGYNLCW